MHERKTNRKSMQGISALIIVVIIIIAVVVVGVGVYLATRGSGANPGTSSTPSPKPSSGTTPLATSTGKISTATSYEFNETGTAPNGTVLDTAFYATKNLGTSNVDLYEVVSTPSSGTLIYVINGGEQKAWAFVNGQWTDISTSYADISPTVDASAGVYVNMLEGWGGSGSFTYTIPSGQQNAGDKVTFTNIKINPSFPDSLFVGPTG